MTGSGACVFCAVEQEQQADVDTEEWRRLVVESMESQSDGTSSACRFMKS